MESTSGGLSVIAVRDFFQLKPVYDDSIVNNLKNYYGPLVRNVWKDLFEILSLTRIMSQTYDLRYAELLNSLPMVQHTKQNIDTFNSRVIGTVNVNEKYPLKIWHIFFTNDSVDIRYELKKK